MGDAYPELRRQQAGIEKVLLAEEEQFAKTLDNGMAILDEALAGLDGDEIPGELVFRLYDTYGFPTDLTNDIARERGLTLNMEGYEVAMAAQRERSKEGGSFRVDYNASLRLEGSTQFTGYEDLAGRGRVLALLRDGEPVSSLAADQRGVVVLDSTPFYAESGGQMGDTGYLEADGARLEVTDTTKAGAHHLHHVNVLEGTVAEEDVRSKPALIMVFVSVRA